MLSDSGLTAARVLAALSKLPASSRSLGMRTRLLEWVLAVDASSDVQAALQYLRVRASSAPAVIRTDTPCMSV